MIICSENRTKAIAAHAANANGSTQCVRRLVAFLDCFGYVDVVLGSDNESAIIVLRDEVANQRVRQIRPVGSVPMRSQTRGRADHAVKDFIGQGGKMKLGIERRVRGTIAVDRPIVHWVVEHAALIVNRHQLGHEGKIADRRKNQRDAPPKQLEFAEQVMTRFAPKRGKSKRKAPPAPLPTHGTWLFIHELIIEQVVVLQPGGAARPRPVFRRNDGERLKFEKIMSVKATPSTPNLGMPSEDVVVLKFEGGSGGFSGSAILERPVRNETPTERKIKFTKRMFSEYGYNGGCV